MSLSGEHRVSRDGKSVPLKLVASATHAYSERILNVGAENLPDKVARCYEIAKAAISVNGDRSEKTLRPERRLMVAQRSKSGFLVYSPAGPLTRDELDLTSDHFDTLSLTGLLPGKAVTVGESWKVSNAVAQALCSFEGLTQQNLECKLEEVNGQTARVSVKGTSTGIDVGALVKLSIDATCLYDLSSRRLTRLEWKQKDDREQGPASPASSMETTITLTRSAIEEPPTLSNVSLVSVPPGFTPPEAMTQLEYHDAKTSFGMLYGRDWQTTSRSDDHLVMRLMDRGDLVSQLTLTPWTKAEKGTHLTPEEVHEIMTKTQGWQPQQELQAGEVPAEKDRYIYRISAIGQLEGRQVMQNYFLVAGPEGEQVVLVFTLEPKQVDRLGTKDLELAGAIEFLSAKKTSPEK
jgi:hypothetical protein